MGHFPLCCIWHWIPRRCVAAVKIHCYKLREFCGQHQWGLTAFGLALLAKSEYEMECWRWEHSFTVGKPCECVLGDGFRATSSAKAPPSHLPTSSMFSCSCSPPHTLQKVQCLQLQILPTITRNYTTSSWVFSYCYKGPRRGRFCCKKQSSRRKTHRVKWGVRSTFSPPPPCCSHNPSQQGLKLSWWL